MKTGPIQHMDEIKEKLTSFEGVTDYFKGKKTLTPEE